MALQTSGAISINDIVGEFGGTAPHALSEYYGVDTGVPASGTIAISDFYGTSSGPSTVTMNGTSGTINSGYYATYGYRLSTGGAIPTYFSSYNNNVGSLNDSNSTPSGRDVIDFRRESNPGFTGVSIYMDGSGGNSGWTTCAWSNAAGTKSGSFNRANCNYTAQSSSSPFTATARWDVGTGYGGSGTSYTGDHPVNIFSGSGQNFTLYFT